MVTAKSVITDAALLAGVLALAIGIAPPLAAHPRSTPVVDSAETLILALDRSIQERFKEIDQKFGFRRIITPNETPHRFRPENAREIAVVRDLDRARLDVMLYVAGRRVLRATPATVHASPSVFYGPIKGPVQVTTTQSGDVDAPAAADLWDEAVNAMLAFRRKDTHGFEVAEWKFIARPVRASDAACLTCHTEARASRTPTSSEGGNSLKIGDPLGAVIYGYRSLNTAGG